MNLQILGGLMIPLIGTTLGSFMVMFMKDVFSKKLEKFLLGFASGVMIAASVWSLIMPSMEMASETETPEWLPAAAGFLIGIFFLLLLDRVIPHIHVNDSEPEGPETSLSNNTMLFLAVTIHNIPEGMAVGVVFAGVIADSGLITLAGATTLAVGIAIQNFPEGAIISMPLKTMGESKVKAFLLGFLSGVVEPIAALITLAITGLITGVLPYLLSFAAGAMIYVVVEELVPEGHEGKHNDYATIGVAIGFVLMMVLDVALG